MSSSSVAVGLEFPLLLLFLTDEVTELFFIFMAQHVVKLIIATITMRMPTLTPIINPKNDVLKDLDIVISTIKHI